MKLYSYTLLDLLQRMLYDLAILDHPHIDGITFIVKREKDSRFTLESRIQYLPKGNKK